MDPCLQLLKDWTPVSDVEHELRWPQIWSAAMTAVRFEICTAI